LEQSEPVIIKNKEETTAYNHYMEHEQALKRLTLNSTHRPIYGILTEPLRGILTLKEVQIENFDEYTPMAHVQFLEQSSIKVVPISYKLAEEDLKAALS
jgi:flagellar assembly factor FliW